MDEMNLMQPEIQKNTCSLQGMERKVSEEEWERGGNK
jgi:hypothetical protein